MFWLGLLPVVRLQEGDRMSKSKAAVMLAHLLHTRTEFDIASSEGIYGCFILRRPVPVRALPLQL